MLPYLVPNDRLPLSVFMAAGIVAAYVLYKQRSQAAGLDPAIAGEMVMWGVFAGLIISFTITFMTGGRPGAFSFGLLLGGISGAGTFLIRAGLTPVERWRYIDAGVFVFPFAWMWPRLGCSMAHDHPGIASRSWLAVDFPHGARYDLGALELLFTWALVALFLFLDRRRQPAGLYFGLFLTLFGVFRLAIDPLRATREYILGWTPDQIFATSGLLAGLWIVVWLAHRRVRYNERL